MIRKKWIAELIAELITQTPYDGSGSLQMKGVKASDIVEGIENSTLDLGPASRPTALQESIRHHNLGSLATYY